MAISNCLFSPTSENPHEFSVLFIFTKLRAQNNATNQTQSRF